MNPNNAPYAGGGGMSGVVKPGMQPPKSENPQVIMSHVAQVLQNQGSYGGWKEEVPIKTRAMNVYQMITSLRLIQPRIDLQQAAQAALSFEQKAFQKANEKSDYEKECTDKLLHIKDTRQRQAAVALQSGIIPQGGPVAGFPPQLTRAVQSSPMPGQPQMVMGMNDPSQAAMQQRAQQQQSAMFQQRAQQRPANGIPLPDELSALPPQELEQVARLANQMLSKTSADDMERIRENLASMNAEQRHYLARKNMDPMTYFFRSQALNQIRRHRRLRMEQAGRQQNGGIDPTAPTAPPVGDSMINNRQGLQMINLQRNSFSGGNPGQGMDPSGFMGNVENIQGQQADGLRSQEAGQLVVPASSSQMNQQPFNSSQNMFTQQMGQNGQGNMNGAAVNLQMFGQQHMQNGSNGAQDRMQFQQSQVQAAQAQARAQAAHKAQMAMSAHGGQSNAQAQSHLPQSSPVMPMLNQPMAPGQMSPVQVPAQSRPASRPPNMGQHPAGLQGGAQPGMQGRPQIPPNLPQAVQEQLSQMSNEQLQAFLMNQRRIAMANNMARNANQQAASQTGQTQAMFNGQMGSNARMRDPMGMQQGMNAGSSQAQPIQGQQHLTAQQRQQQQQQRQNEMWKRSLLNQHNTGMEMTAEQSKFMDRTPFPPSIINNNPSQVPKHIKNWGQLKQWVSANPLASNGVDLGKLMTLQKLHFAQMVAAHQAKDSNGQGPGAMTHSFQAPQHQMPNGQNFSTGQAQTPANLPMRAITPQDIQVARQKLGQQARNYSDDQIREILRNRQRQMLLQTAHARAQMGGIPIGQNPMMPQTPATTAQSVPHANPTSISQPSQAMSDPHHSGLKSQPAGAPSKGGKMPPGKQAMKNRANDGTGETRTPTATPQQPQLATPATAAPARPIPLFTSEQYAAMSPQQRLQVESHMRRQQQHMVGGPILNKVQAEEAWQKSIPQQIQQLYDELKSSPISGPKPMTPEQKSTVSKLLLENLDVLGRLDALVLQGIGKMPGQEKNVRNLITMHIQIMRQFKPGPDWILNDYFSIDPEYLNGAILFIRKLFQLMLIRFNQQQQQQRSNANQTSASAAPTAQTSNTALNATNLQQLQQQEEAFQRARRASSQSVAVAPAPFGAPSPQGVPHAYGPGGLAPEKLKLPPPKRRKQSHAGVSASPVQSSAPAVASAATKYAQTVGDAKSTAAALSGAFKCGVVECQNHFQGFPTQAALDKHVEDTHQPEEEEAIDNPMQFYLDSVTIGLGLDGPSGPNQQPAPVIPNNSINKLNAMASPSNQGLTTPGTANTTPMARATSQLGAKTASPAISTQQLTPQQSSGKSAKPSPGHDGTKPTGKRTRDESEAKDLWEDCPMSLEKIHDSFEPIFTDSRVDALGHDPFDTPQSVVDFFHPDFKWEPDWSDRPQSTLTDDEKAKQAAEKTEEEARWEAWLTPWTEEMVEKCSKWTKIPREMMFGDDEDDVPEFAAKDTGLGKGTAIAIAAV